MFEVLPAQVHVPEEQGHAHLFLAQYHLKRRKFSDAEAHAHKCTEFLDVSCITTSLSYTHTHTHTHSQDEGGGKVGDGRGAETKVNLRICRKVTQSD